MRRGSGASRAGASPNAWHAAWARRFPTSSRKAREGSLGPQHCGQPVRHLLITRPSLCATWRHARHRAPDRPRGGEARNARCAPGFGCRALAQSLPGVAACRSSEAREWTTRRAPSRSAARLDGQALATLGAASGDDGTAATRLHAHEEAVGTGAAGLGGLIGTLQWEPLLRVCAGRAQRLAPGGKSRPTAGERQKRTATRSPVRENP